MCISLSPWSLFDATAVLWLLASSIGDNGG
jgi:hypothetical protein